MEEWDPIGVRDAPEAADEFDSYLGPIGARLREGKDAAEIAAYLTDVEEERMGLGFSEAARTPDPYNLTCPRGPSSRASRRAQGSNQ
jgi:hypothetical protein